MVVHFCDLDKIRKEEKISALLESEDEDDQCSSSTTSSIGKDSDASECRDNDDDNEAESKYNYDEPLNMMDSPQQFLPIRYTI